VCLSVCALACVHVMNIIVIGIQCQRVLVRTREIER
jgi:hypothetical protein